MAAMKQYKICVGVCGPQLIYTNIIRAHTPEEAVQKYLDDIGEPFTQEKFDSLLKMTSEHIPKPRKKKEQSDLKVPPVRFIFD